MTALAIEFHREGLSVSEQSLVSDGFREHSEEHGGPEYQKARVKWLASDQDNKIQGVLTADILWDWIYIDELWVSPASRGAGLGRQLVSQAEDFAKSQELVGIWLWTQSWQAENFYRRLGYDEFARFDDFPKGHYRVGFRKYLG